ARSTAPPAIRARNRGCLDRGHLSRDAPDQPSRRTLERKCAPHADECFPARLSCTNCRTVACCPDFVSTQLRPRSHLAVRSPARQLFPHPADRLRYLYPLVPVGTHELRICLCADLCEDPDGLELCGRRPDRNTARRLEYSTAPSLPSRRILY